MKNLCKMESTPFTIPITPNTTNNEYQGVAPKGAKGKNSFPPKLLSV